MDLIKRDDVCKHLLSNKDPINKYSYFFLSFFIFKKLFSLEALILYKKYCLGVKQKFFSYPDSISP